MPKKKRWMVIENENIYKQRYKKTWWLVFNKFRMFSSEPTRNWVTWAPLAIFWLDLTTMCESRKKKFAFGRQEWLICLENPKSGSKCEKAETNESWLKRACRSDELLIGSSGRVGVGKCSGEGFLPCGNVHDESWGSNCFRTWGKNDFEFFGEGRQFAAVRNISFLMMTTNSSAVLNLTQNADDLEKARHNLLKSLSRALWCKLANGEDSIFLFQCTWNESHALRARSTRESSYGSNASCS